MPDTDDDGDGTANCLDGCPDDPDKVDPGTCGCGTAEGDSGLACTANAECQDGVQSTWNYCHGGTCGLQCAALTDPKPVTGALCSTECPDGYVVTGVRRWMGTDIVHGVAMLCRQLRSSRGYEPGVWVSPTCGFEQGTMEDLDCFERGAFSVAGTFVSYANAQGNRARVAGVVCHGPTPFRAKRQPLGAWFLGFPTQGSDTKAGQSCGAGLESQTYGALVGIIEQGNPSTHGLSEVGIMPYCRTGHRSYESVCSGHSPLQVNSCRCLASGSVPAWTRSARGSAIFFESISPCRRTLLP